MHLGDVADDPRLDPLVDQAGFVPGVALVAHLGDHARPLGDLGQGAGLVHGVGERLLDVHVLSGLHRGLRHCGMEVVGGRDEDRVQVFLAVEELAEVGVLARLQELLAPALALFAGIAVAIGQPLLHPPVHDAPVHVADRGDVLGSELLRVLGALPADPDDGEVQAVGGRLVTGAAEDVAGDDHGAGGDAGAALHETSAAESVGHWWMLRWGRGLPVR